MTSAYMPSGVWILDDGLIMGGGQRFALRLAEVMRADGTTVRMVVPERSRVAAEARGRGIEVIDARYPRLVPPAVWAMPSAILRLRRVLREAPPNALIVGNTARCQAYATAAMLTLPDRPLFVHLMQEQDSAHRITARAVYRRIGALVAVGENAARTYKERLPHVPVTCANNFVAPDDMARLAAQRTPPPGGKRPIVGVLARMIREKGILELVEELAAIPDAWERLLVGAPEQDRRYADQVRARVRDLGLSDRIELLGEVHDLERFFASIDALVVPSTGNEGQPTVIIESLLYARPVVLRHALWSRDFADLPVRAYASPDELAQALAASGSPPATVDELQLRFGAPQVVATLQEAAVSQRRQQLDGRRPDELTRPIGGRRTGRREWTRHLMRHRTVTPRGAPVPTASSYLAFAAGLPRAIFHLQGRQFEFDGERLPYLYDRYNLTWLNERTVEVPLAARILERRRGERVLEIGNVLGHYGHRGHEVVDKYEQGPGVRNIDVLDLERDRRWDLILSISTLEHVGVDDAPHDPARGAAATRLLADRLTPGGELLVTVPIGYNPALDEALVGGTVPGLDLRALRRTGLGPHWAPAEPEDVLGLGYDWRNSSARAVLVGRLGRPA